MWSTISNTKVTNGHIHKYTSINVKLSFVLHMNNLNIQVGWQLVIGWQARG